MRKIFLDTNIVLDVILNRTGHVENALKIISLVDLHKYEGWISSLSCSNVYYITARHFNKITAMKKLEHFRVKIRISSVYEETIDLALSSDFNDFEDAIQYYSALSVKCDCIITRNIKDYKISEIPVYTPEEFIALYKENR